MNIYLYYIKHCGINICALYMVLAILWQALRLYADMSLGNWSSDNIDAPQRADQNYEVNISSKYVKFKFLKMCQSKKKKGH